MNSDEGGDLIQEADISPEDEGEDEPEGDEAPT